MQLRESDIKEFESYATNPEYIHIVKDMLLKKIITPGDLQDQIPSENAKVTVHYTGTLLDGTQFDSSRTRNDPFEFQIGQSQVIKAWDQGIATMCIGERCDLILHPSFGYGESGSGQIPGNAALRFDVEALDFAEIDHEYPETLELRREASKGRQERGKQLFNQNKVKRALACFEKGNELLEDDQIVESRKQRAKMLGNTCLCYYKLNNIQKCIVDGKQSMEILKEFTDEDDLMSKVIKRIIRAYLDQNKFDDVIALEKDNSINSHVQSLIQNDIVKAKEKQREVNAKKNDMYKRMMSFRTEPGIQSIDTSKKNDECCNE
ncbi:Peptidylprolyl isomerase [Spironucleus salmonicida]|uniref:peptidylprolyl isomerase n=1 Tax=Spironucleus salmonicida TaxID=348837 RepID=V6LN68_9EUKA|nr:Peptidylprolyl isomerase [Spironucleus salmonicida]|eukprot:EST45663.1 FKBP-type peptidyl-prolyl cis-trans isomerase [Spironucleus salmonicida]